MVFKQAKVIKIFFEKVNFSIYPQRNLVPTGSKAANFIFYIPSLLMIKLFVFQAVNKAFIYIF